MEKKKRGRKPKNNIVLNENPVFENENDGDNLFAGSCQSEIVLMELQR